MVIGDRGANFLDTERHAAARAEAAEPGRRPGRPDAGQSYLLKKICLQSVA
jgi:hypothetical protein